MMGLRQQGFTLIEILLVIVIITVASAMVAPSFFGSLGSDINSEARYLHKQLRMVADEAQLTGKPVRCSVWQDHLLFFTPGNGQWQALAEASLARFDVVASMQISEASLDASDGLSSALDQIDQAWQQQRDEQTSSEQQRDDKQQIPAMADFIFWPDGSVTQGMIELSLKTGEEHRRIRLQSGLGGIRLLEAEQ